MPILLNVRAWTAPFWFTDYVKKKQFTIAQEISLLWVRERSIPSNRQNIAFLVDQSKLIPVKKDAKGNLYLKADK